MVTVALHPVGLDSRTWQWLGLRFDITPDLPGDTPDDELEDFSLDDLANQVAALIPSPADVVGVAMGSLVAQHLVVRHPEKVRSLLLACAPAEMTDSSTHVRRAVSGFGQGMDRVADLTATRWFTPAGLASAAPPVMYALERLRELSPMRFAKLWAAVAGHRLADRLSAVNCPTTVLSAMHDLSSPPPELHQLNKLIRGSRFVSIDGPHMIQLEQPDALTRVIHEHLSWVETTAR